MIILASKSQLRKQVLELAGLPFMVVSADIDERRVEEDNPTKTPEEIVELLAVTKAQHVAQDHPDDIVIAADTFGVLPDGERLHKTQSVEESIQLALRQSGKTTTVNTGVALCYAGKTYSYMTTTKVTYTDFDEETVRQLFSLTAGEDRRHASLGFFIDAPGFTLVKTIEGSYMGAMGLPLDVIRPHLKSAEHTARP